MRINSSKAHEAFAAYNKVPDATRTSGSEAQATNAISKPQAPDRAEISENGRQFAQALDAVRQSPETRADLVSSLKQQVQSGTYTINGEQLADKIAQHIDVTA
jgi:flagellar biosynthesis anti-sigma factor FlgM